jgi:WhiB family redox-sensing transcriptional regulator
VTLNVSNVPPPGEWSKRGRCWNQPHLVEQFFPGPHKKVQVKHLCDECPVRPECRDYALANPSLQGYWGGTRHEERLKMADRRSARPRHQRPSAYKAPAIPKDLLLNISETRLTREEYYQVRGA